MLCQSETFITTALDDVNVAELWHRAIPKYLFRRRTKLLQLFMDGAHPVWNQPPEKNKFLLFKISSFCPCCHALSSSQNPLRRSDPPAMGLAFCVRRRRTWTFRTGERNVAYNININSFSKNIFSLLKGGGAGMEGCLNIIIESPKDISLESGTFLLLQNLTNSPLLQSVLAEDAVRCVVTLMTSRFDLQKLRSASRLLSKVKDNIIVVLAGPEEEPLAVDVLAQLPFLPPLLWVPPSLNKVLHRAYINN